VPFEVPKGWAWCNFTEVADLISGQDFPPEKYNSNAQGTPYIIGASNIEKGCLKINRWTEYPSVLSQKGDVLVVCKGAGVGKVAVNDLGIVHIARQIQAVRIQYDIVSSDFMRILIDWCVPSIVSQANGLIPGLKRELLQGVLLPIPPQNEQERIVSTVCEAYAIIDDLEVKKEQIESYIKKTKEQVLDLAIHGKLVPQDASDEPSIKMLRRMNPAFKPSDNLHYKDCPKGWIKVTVADVFEINPKIQGDEDADAGFVPMTNIRDGFCNMFSFEVRKWAKIKNGFTRFANGDIAVAKISPCLENRKSVIMRDLPNGIGAGTTELNIFRSRVVDPEYGLLFFKSKYFINSCAGSYNGVVGQQRVSRSLIEEMQFLLPPLEEQKRIVATINEYFAVINEISYSLQ
jgi:type I restriction enzyme S subunit